MTRKHIGHGLLTALATLLVLCSIATMNVTVAISLTATAILVPGTKGPNSTAVETPSFIESMMRQELQGWVYNQATDGWVMDTYPRSMGKFTGKNDPMFDQSTSIGMSNLDIQIHASLTSVLIGFGYSQGATVVTDWLNAHANGKDPAAPAADKASFVLIGNPNRPNGGILARMPGLHIPFIGVTFNGATPESQYKVTDVVRQYDLFGDFPKNPLNVLAVLNVLADAGAIHGNYLNVDVNDPRNWVEQHGNTTYIMEYAQHLPLLVPLYKQAALSGRTATPLLDAVEPVLRYLVELGYDRTNQSTATTFRLGSSVTKAVRTLPQLVQAVEQGVNTYQTESQQQVAATPRVLARQTRVTTVPESVTPSRNVPAHRQPIAASSVQRTVTSDVKRGKPAASRSQPSTRPAAAKRAGASTHPNR